MLRGGHIYFKGCIFRGKKNGPEIHYSLPFACQRWELFHYSESYIAVMFSMKIYIASQNRIAHPLNDTAKINELKNALSFLR